MVKTVTVRSRGVKKDALRSKQVTREGSVATAGECSMILLRTGPVDKVPGL